MIDDPYSVLGLTPDASDEEVKRAYRALANELTRASSALAAEWITVSVLGKIAVEMTDE